MDTCGFCGVKLEPAARFDGLRATICRACVGAGLVATLTTSAAGAAELPEADQRCDFCDKPTPTSASHRSERTSICASCLARAYELGASPELETRRRRWRGLHEPGVAQLVRAHFAPHRPEDLVTSSRSFPVYLRVDLNRVLLERLGQDACHGLHAEYTHETMTFPSLFSPHERVAVAPVRFDQVDVGEVEAARCLQNGLWLTAEPTPHAVLLSMGQQYGQTTGCHVEIAVAPGAAGEALTRALFSEIERAVERAASLRGKVLSLEKAPHTQGTAGAVQVHRLAPVSRDDVILPEVTLALLERNVFGFDRHRAALRGLGLPVKKGLLLYGPPGTGKTHTVRYLAGALPGHTTLLVTAEQVELLAHYMVLARLLAPSIVVIEDADLIASDRAAVDTVWQEVLLNKLLNEMDGLKENAEILFVLTTNRPEALETALRARPGRIDQAIEFPLPDEAGRQKLALLYARDLPFAEGTLDHIVARTAGVSAAFVKELVRRSAQFSLERSGSALAPPDVDAALNEMLVQGGRLNAELLGASGALTPS